MKSEDKRYEIKVSNATENNQSYFIRITLNGELIYSSGSYPVINGIASEGNLFAILAGNEIELIKIGE